MAKHILIQQVRVAARGSLPDLLECQHLQSPRSLFISDVDDCPHIILADDDEALQQLYLASRIDSFAS